MRRFSTRRTSRSVRPRGRTLTAILNGAGTNAIPATAGGSNIFTANTLANMESASSQDLVGAYIRRIYGVVNFRPSTIPVVAASEVYCGFGFRMMSSLEAGLPVATRATLYGPYSTGINLAGWRGRHQRIAFYAAGASNSTIGQEQTVSVPFSARIGLRLTNADQQVTFVAETTSSPIAVNMMFLLHTELVLP